MSCRPLLRMRSSGATPLAGRLERKCGCGCSPLVDDVLRSPGEPLEAATRARFESALGRGVGSASAGTDAEHEADRASLRPEATAPSGLRHDFSRVRVHTGARAEESARSVGALAYTVGDHIVFGAGRYHPGTEAGSRLLAHELTHTLQQRAGPVGLARQCDPAWAPLPWARRVANVRSMAAGAPRDQCMADMIDEALYPNVTVEERTNAAASVDRAIATGRYAEWGTLSDLHVNFDRNLNAKTGDPNQFGDTRFRTGAGGGSIRIFIVLGPRALDPVGPQHTRMAFEHENAHAGDFLLQFALRGSTPHAATSGEELRIYTEGFSQFFLDLWTIDNAARSFSLSSNFMEIFTNYAAGGTTAAQKASALASIRMFFDVRVVGIPCNVMKFKIWLQMMQNARPARDALVALINAFPGMGLVRRTAPATHLNVALGCS